MAELKKENAYHVYFDADPITKCRRLNIPIKQIIDAGIDMGESVYLAYVTPNHILLTQNENEDGIFSKINGWFKILFMRN